MLTEWAYAGDSDIAQDAAGTVLRLSPNLRREPAHLRGGVADPLAFRDALLALHDCARSEHFATAEEIERRAADPVVTVTREAVFFEAFSLDESSYGRVTLRESALRDVRRLAPGCTNVDFSARLRAGIERIRSASPVVLQVEAEALTIDAVRETRIDLPDGWAHGFLAVQASLRRPAERVDLHPADLRNLVAYLRGRKETASPRSLRFRLAPGEAPVVEVEPWGERLVCVRSRHAARTPREVRVWGRRRLLALWRLLPAARAAKVLLLGTGQPSFWTLEAGPVSLTLGLSPWSERDWTADAIPLDGWPEPPEEEIERVSVCLAQAGSACAGEVAAIAELTRERALAALDALCAAGRALYDPDGERFHARRLFAGDPPPPPAPERRLHEARRIVRRGGVAADSRETRDGERTVRATVRGNGVYRVDATLDAAGRLLRGACACPFFARFGWRRGPCKHLLAVREAEAGP